MKTTATQKQANFLNITRWMVALCTCLLMLSANATVRRVDINATTTSPDGYSWPLAYRNLQTAINASVSGDEVWIAAGTYPTVIGGYYSMKNGVKIYGGFTTAMTVLSQRNWKVNNVTLQGNNNSVFINGGVTSSALLDGVTIKGGTAVNGAGMYNDYNASPTIFNVIFDGNTASNRGGGMYNSSNGSGSSVPVLTNVVFKNNSADYGGGLYQDQGYNIVFTNVVFANNQAAIRGGGMEIYGTTGSPKIVNCVFYRNTVLNASRYGAGLLVGFCNLTILNCSFYGNFFTAGSGDGSAVYLLGGNIYQCPVTNSVFWGNTSPDADNWLYSDYALYGYNSFQLSYCFTQTNSWPGSTPGTGNVTGSASPFRAQGNGDGADNIWGTADDGLQLSICNGAPAIDKGTNAPVTETADITGAPRKVNVGIVPDGGTGTAPIVDMGAYENQISGTAAQIGGRIGNAHIITNPRELIPDYITDSVAPASEGTLTWQDSTANGTWQAAPSSGNQASYNIPQLSVPNGYKQTTYYFRRVLTLCSVKYYSNVILIKVVIPDGRIIGTVHSKGTGIQGDTVIAKHYPGTRLSGTDTNYTYTAITEQNGSYTLHNLYYGDPANPNDKDSFDIRVIKKNHGFNPGVYRKVLRQDDPQPNAPVDFEDTTVLTVTGRTYQLCPDCINTTASSYGCPVDSVTVKGIVANNPQFTNTSGFKDTAYGRYAIAVDNIGIIKIQPTFNSHNFDPASRQLNITNDVTGQDFRDTTTHVISGYLKASCNEFIGMATLEFSDVLTDASGNPRVSCFTKRINTNSGGNYSIRLPARKYSVKVISYTPRQGLATTDPAYIIDNNLIDFFNTDTYIKKDSLIRDITQQDTTLNLLYERPPVLQIVSGLNTAVLCNGQPRGFAVMEQAKMDSIRVKVYQGAPTLNNGNGCLVNDTSKVTLVTNVPSLDNGNLSAVYFRPADTGVVVRFNGGTPNVAGNHFKTVNLQFADKYGRQAPQILTNVLVTGARADDGANFFTVSPPEIPLLVLHDPPGDGSNSTWESTRASETAFRMYAAKGGGVKAWAEIKLGLKLSTGIFVSSENEVWATATGTFAANANSTSSTEKIISTRYTQGLSTSSLPTEVGADGDLYTGLALNLIYTSAKEVRYNSTTCAISDTTTMIFANNGTPTEFHYSEKHIKEVIIPQLVNSAAIQPTQQKKDSVLNHMKQWQQMIDNNIRNKAAASFDKAINFNGGGSVSSYSTTSTKTETNTTEFTMVIDAALALAAGLEVAGSGGSLGAEVNFKTETGESNTNTSIQETTVGYQLTDANSGDAFALNVRKDQVSGTPVFELLAGQSSCPPEAGTQLRDQVDVAAPVPIATDTNQVGTVEFLVKIANNSAITTDASRPFRIYLDGASNPDGAGITINGVTTNEYAPLLINVNRGAELPVTVRVTKAPTSQVFTYRDLKVVVVDNCSADISKSVLLSALFVSPCSSVVLAAPANGWKLSGSGYTIQLLVKNYTIANLTSINLQYALAGTSNWIDGGITLTPASLNPNSANGTNINWNTQGLADGSYTIRLKLLCPQGVVYSETASGNVDHTPPVLLGRPDPTDDNYVNGDVIAFSYNEKLNTATLNSGKVVMTRLSNNTDVPVTVSGYENRIVIVPVNPIAGYTGETIRVIVKNISDENGNEKVKNDTSYFMIGTTTIATGNNALIVSLTNPAVYKNADSVINILFKLPVSRAYDTRVNYTVSGTARLGIDYNITYGRVQPAYTYNNGSQGAISIAKDSLATVLHIVPVKDTAWSLDKTIIINATEGGDYSLGTPTSVTGTLTSEDGINVYIFTGDGNWNIKNNWQNGNMPLTTLVAPKEIIINPSGTCLLNVKQTIKPNAKITVKQNRRFVIQSSLKIQ